MKKLKKAIYIDTTIQEMENGFPADSKMYLRMQQKLAESEKESKMELQKIFQRESNYQS